MSLVPAKSEIVPTLYMSLLELVEQFLFGSTNPGESMKVDWAMTAGPHLVPE